MLVLVYLVMLTGEMVDVLIQQASVMRMLSVSGWGLDLQGRTALTAVAGAVGRRKSRRAWAFHMMMVVVSISAVRWPHYRHQICTAAAAACATWLRVRAAINAVHLCRGPICPRRTPGCSGAQGAKRGQVSV